MIASAARAAVDLARRAAIDPMRCPALAPARRALFAGLVVIGLAAVPSAAFADAKAAAPAGSASSKPAPKPADKAAAKKLLAQGNQLVGEGDYLGALEKFRAAYDKFPSPKILLNVGTTLRQLGRNVEAAEVYERYLKDPEHDAAREKDVQRVLAEIDAVVGHIVVTLDDPAATLRLDGKQIEPFEKGESRRVEPGEHTLTAEKPGAATVVQSIVVKPRQEHLVNLRFAPVVPKVEQSVSTTQRTLGLALGGVGAVATLAGAVVGIVAVTQSGAAASHCFEGGKACDQKGVDLDQSAKTASVISTVGFAVGGGLLAAGALMFVLSPSPTKEAAPTPSSPTATSNTPRTAARWLFVQPSMTGASISFGGAF